MEIGGKKQRIVILGPAHPFRGGIADTNEALARAMQRAGHEVHLVTFTVQYPSLLFPGKTQFSVDKKPEDLNIHRWIHSMNPINWWSAAHKILRLKPTFVLVRYWQPLLAPCFGSVVRMLKGKVKVIGLTDNIIPHEKRTGDEQLTSYFMKGCHGFMALSSAVEDDLKSLTKKPTSFFPHPINDQLGALAPREDAIAKLNLDSNNRYILFFGIIRKYKGLDLLLDAMALEKVRNLNLKLIVAGEFYDREEDYREQIERLNISDNVLVVPKFIASEDVPHYFSVADVVVQTYRSATQSGITQMALHFEKPVIVTRVGGLEEFVKEGNTGLFADPDPESVADSLVEFYAQQNADWSKNIREVKKAYSWDTFVTHLLDFSLKV